ncbi:hypothetical protein bcere0002_14810 [Bacillus cereus ATCC 10876]|nr:hypothetical protein bcere0002_14810 [Bacillus cereus ATCC 10876]
MFIDKYKERFLRRSKTRYILKEESKHYMHTVLECCSLKV